MRRLFKVLATALVLFGSSIASAQPCCEQETVRRQSVTFVANYDELESALKIAAKGEIGSIAISMKFYQEGSARWAQLRMLGLVTQILGLHNYAVYFYGPALDKTAAEELLGVSAPEICAAPVLLGKIIPAKSPEAPIMLCGFGGETSEEGLRSRISRNYERERERLGK